MARRVHSTWIISPARCWQRNTTRSSITKITTKPVTTLTRERTIVTAVNYAPLIGATRNYAEARCRLVFGLSALSAGTPMFLMGEEIGAAKYFLYDTFASNKEDLVGERTGDGQFLFRFYQDLIGLVTCQPAARSSTLDVIYRHNDNRVIAFTRSSPGQQLLVLASLNDSAVRSRVCHHDGLLAAACRRMAGDLQ